MLALILWGCTVAKSPEETSSAQHDDAVDSNESADTADTSDPAEPSDAEPQNPVMMSPQNPAMLSPQNPTMLLLSHLQSSACTPIALAPSIESLTAAG